MGGWDGGCGGDAVGVVEQAVEDGVSESGVADEVRGWLSRLLGSSMTGWRTAS